MTKISDVLIVCARKKDMLSREMSVTYSPRSKLFLLSSIIFSPESPFSPNNVIYTFASVPAPDLFPVYTLTLYLLSEIIKQIHLVKCKF